jgi:hypothetical protein
MRFTGKFMKLPRRESISRPRRYSGPMPIFWKAYPMTPTWMKASSPPRRKKKKKRMNIKKGAWNILSSSFG